MSKKKIKKNIKNKNIHYDNNTYYNEEFKKLAIIVGIILLIFVLIYLIIGIFVTKEINWFKKDNKTTETTIQYTKILASETFSQTDNEYYVIFSDSDSVNYSTYELIVSNNKDKKIYIVDMSNPLNSKYKNEKGNSNVSSLENLKINGDTMLKVTDKKNSGYFEGSSLILSQFKK